ncbi:MAG TPA: YkgJ family cysteine cluster protein [Sphingomicrobium sp.]
MHWKSPESDWELRVTPAVGRFSCTRCGKCCNRPPEVELSEAAALADSFVFRLMFRLYWFPRGLADYLELNRASENAAALFYQKKRLLSAFAAREYPAQLSRRGRAVEHKKYLMISALALDTRHRACSALNGSSCGIYERRPLACRSVPFHYSRADASAESDLKAFVQTPGYACDTSEEAGLVLDKGRLVDPETRRVRAEAMALAQLDRGWSKAIARRMDGGGPEDPLVPSLEEIELNSAFGATTISMRAAWQIALQMGLMHDQEFNELIEAQLTTIDRELAAGNCSQEARETLVEMRAEYEQSLANRAGAGRSAPVLGTTSGT